MRNGTMTMFSPVIDFSRLAARWLVDPTVVVPMFRTPGFSRAAARNWASVPYVEPELTAMMLANVLMPEIGRKSPTGS